MIATRIEIQWVDSAWQNDPRALPLVRQIARPQPQLRCPRCHSILYTRRHKLCGVCEAELPDQVLFSEHEAARVTQLLRSEKDKHRAWLSRAQAPHPVLG